MLSGGVEQMPKFIFLDECLVLSLENRLLFIYFLLFEVEEQFF